MEEQRMQILSRLGEIGVSVDLADPMVTKSNTSATNQSKISTSNENSLSETSLLSDKIKQKNIMYKSGKLIKISVFFLIVNLFKIY
jgi:hypothetical protein